MPSWSPYNYTIGNPIKLIDPDGRMPQDCCGGGPTIADEFVPSLIAAGKQLWHSISRNSQIVFGGKKPEDIPYREYSTQWNGERSVVVYTEHSVEPSTAKRIVDNTVAGIGLAGVVPSSGSVLSAKGIAAMVPAIAKQFDNFQCVECADAIMTALGKEGIVDEIVTIQAKGDMSTRAGNVWSDTAQKTISTNGHHQGVLVDGKVYDNVHPDGISFDDWKADFHSLGGFKD